METGVNVQRRRSSVGKPENDIVDRINKIDGI